MARFGKTFLITLLLLGLLLSTTAVITGCGDETTTGTTGTTATVAKENGLAIGDRALQVLAATPTSGDFANSTISAAKLSEKLAGAEKDQLFVVDIRGKADFDKGHIEGATQIDFKSWATPENLNKLPQGKKIIVVCYTGNTAAQTVTGMRMLGYDAITLMAGMNGWAQTSLTQTVVNELAATDNPVVTTPSTATAKEAPPAGGTLQKPSDADYKTLSEKAAKVQSEMETSGDYANYTVAPAKLIEKLAGAEKDKLFLVDIRGKADFDKGHIDGAINIPYLSAAVPDNLKLLPKDKKIVVICYTGNTAAQVSTIYNFLDYDSVILKYGMMGWSGNGKEGYLSAIQAAGNPVVTS